MKSPFKHSLILTAIALVSAAALTITACKASGGAGGTGEFPTPAGPVTFGFGIGLNQPWSAHNDSNIQFHIRFFDEGGNVVGEATLPAGGTSSGTLPETSTRWEATSEAPTHAPSGSGGGSGGMSDEESAALVISINGQGQVGGARQNVGRPTGARTFMVIGGPLWFDRDSTNENALYCFMITASDENEALALSRETIEAPIGSPIDSRVDVQTFFKAYEGGGSAHMVALAQDRFTLFAVDFNGQADYATLGNGATQTALGGGLYRVDVPVSYSDIHGYGQYNSFRYRTFHGGNDIVQVGAYELIHEL